MTARPLTPEEHVMAALLPILGALSDAEIERALARTREHLAGRRYRPVANCDCCRARRHVYAPGGVGPCVVCDHAFRTQPC